MVAIANATTEVAVAKTVGEIMELLTRLGARAIMVRYDDAAAPSGVGFEIVTEHGPRAFELPVQVSGVLQAISARDSGVPPRMRTRAHANRVAWRIAKDWLRAQVALTEAKIATPVQVMLPYVVVERDTETGRSVTLYERYQAGGEQLALPSGIGTT